MSRSVATAVCACLLFCSPVDAVLVDVEFNDADGPHWFGTVDTANDWLVIDTWTENAGGITYWRPSPDSLPLTWPAVLPNGSSYDVPDTFNGTISDTWGFISSQSSASMSWKSGDDDVTFTEPDAHPGWGGFVNVDGFRRVNTNHAQVTVPITATTQSTASGTSNVVTAVPESSAVVNLSVAFLVVLCARRIQNVAAVA